MDKLPIKDRLKVNAARLEQAKKEYDSAVEEFHLLLKEYQYSLKSHIDGKYTVENKMQYKFDHDSNKMDSCEGYCTCSDCNHLGIWTCARLGCKCCTTPLSNEVATHGDKKQ